METTFLWRSPDEKISGTMEQSAIGVRLSAVSPEVSGGCRFNP